MKAKGDSIHISLQKPNDAAVHLPSTLTQRTAEKRAAIAGKNEGSATELRRPGNRSLKRY